MSDIEDIDDKKDFKKFIRDTITYVVSKKMNTFSMKLDSLSKKLDKNLEYTTYILNKFKESNSETCEKINILENQLNDLKVIKNKSKVFINKYKEQSVNNNFMNDITIHDISITDIDSNIINDNNDEKYVDINNKKYKKNKNEFTCDSNKTKSIIKNGNDNCKDHGNDHGNDNCKDHGNDNCKDTYKEIKNEVYDLDTNFIKNCLHQNSIDGEIELFKKIYIDNITKEFYPIRHIKKKYQYWNDDKMNDDDSNGTYIKNTIINNIEKSYFSINIIEEYNNDIDQFIKNQEYISKLNEQKYRDKFFTKIISIINI